jgi:transcriptional regulator with XRE-family HTH domain
MENLMVQHRKIVAEFEDRYGDTRVIHRDQRGALKLANNSSTVALTLNRAAAKLVGQRIRNARIAAGLTLEQLCTRAGLVSGTPKSRMWEIENAIRESGLRIGTLYALAEALNLPAYALLPSNEDVLTLAGVSEIKPEPRLAVAGRPINFRVAAE